MPRTFLVKRVGEGDENTSLGGMSIVSGECEHNSASESCDDVNIADMISTGEWQLVYPFLLLHEIRVGHDNSRAARVLTFQSVQRHSFADSRENEREENKDDTLHIIENGNWGIFAIPVCWKISLALLVLR